VKKHWEIFTVTKVLM